ncbi:MAG: hypothetical protein JO002_11865, partial [Burkholderiaceae bacterium]|nr:hypothetical protein [Burkholderiaceae bacterium]
IQPEDVAEFVLAQLLGTAAATGLFGWLYPATSNEDTADETISAAESA